MMSQDLIKLNASETGAEGSDETFRMKNAVTAFGADVSATYKGSEINVHEDSGY